MIDYAEEVDNIQWIPATGGREQAYASLASRLREERDRFKTERDNLQHRLDFPPMTDEVDVLAKLAYETDRNYVSPGDTDNTWEENGDAWDRYRYYLMACAVRGAVLRAWDAERRAVEAERDELQHRLDAVEYCCRLAGKTSSQTDFHGLFGRIAAILEPGHV